MKDPVFVSHEFRLKYFGYGGFEKWFEPTRCKMDGKHSCLLRQIGLLHLTGEGSEKICDGYKSQTGYKSKGKQQDDFFTGCGCHIQ
jgi:hypothetical protein